MRYAIGAFLVLCCAVAARAGVAVELTDGTKLTVETYWTDGDQMHLVRGGVDMIVPKSRVKHLDEDVADPEVATSHGRADDGAAAKADAAPAGDDAQAKQDGQGEKKLSEMSAAELQTLHEDESQRILDAQVKRFSALYGGSASKDDQKQAQKAFDSESKRNADIWFALQKAKKAEAEGQPAVPTVAQPN